MERAGGRSTRRHRQPECAPIGKCGTRPRWGIKVLWIAAVGDRVSRAAGPAGPHSSGETGNCGERTRRCIAGNAFGARLFDRQHHRWRHRLWHSVGVGAGPAECRQTSDSSRPWKRPVGDRRAAEYECDGAIIARAGLGLPRAVRCRGSSGDYDYAGSGFGKSTANSTSLRTSDSRDRDAVEKIQQKYPTSCSAEGCCIILYRLRSF
mmetsp:Transcript_4734/g.9984  ORF Transcript_4734/g.9984 Transcript_4734/m.9984 type:complete len:207 (-) Transcript_4734:34-654(-)